MKAIESTPISASSGWKPRCARHQSWSASRPAECAEPARAEEACSIDGHDGREDLPVDVVEEVDEEKERQGAPRGGSGGRGGRHRGFRPPRGARAEAETTGIGMMRPF